MAGWVTLTGSERSHALLQALFKLFWIAGTLSP
jgi:hypothetical protein